MVRPFRHFSFLISYASGIFKRNQRVVRPLGELCIPKNKRMTHINLCRAFLFAGNDNFSALENTI